MMEYFLNNSPQILVRIYDDYNNVKSKKLIKINENPYIYQSINDKYYSMSVPIEKPTRIYVEIENPQFDFKIDLCYITITPDMKKQKLENMDYYELSQSFMDIEKEIDGRRVIVSFKYFRNDNNYITLTTPIVEIH